MTDRRAQTCGGCDHFRPREDEEESGICGGQAPKVIVFGSLQVVNPDNPDDKGIEPLVGTFRPEVHADDPSCFMWRPYGEPDLEEQLIRPIPSRICKAPGCNCLRDGESEFCVDHEPDSEPSQTIRQSDERLYFESGVIEGALSNYLPPLPDARAIEIAVSESPQFLANRLVLRVIAHFDHPWEKPMSMALVSIGRDWFSAPVEEFRAALRAKLAGPDVFVPMSDDAAGDEISVMYLPDPSAPIPVSV